MKFFNSILFLLLSIAANAQTFEEELRSAVKTKPKFEYRMDSRHSFINQTGVKTFGFKLGVQFQDKLSFGLGYNQLWSPLTRDLVIDNLEKEVELGFFNLTPYVEYVFYRDERWELSIPVQIGLGNSFYRKTSGSGDKIFKEFVLSYEPAITCQYRVLKYLGVGLGIGYRFMIVPNRQIEEKFTSPVFIFKSRIYFQDILRDLKHD